MLILIINGGRAIYSVPFYNIFSWSSNSFSSSVFTFSMTMNHGCDHEPWI